MVVILFYHDRPQPLVGHMPLDALDTAGNSAAIEDMTYFNSTIPLFWIIINLFHLMAEFLIFLLPVWGYTNQSFVIGASWKLQGTAKLWYRVIFKVMPDERNYLSYCSFANMAVAFFNISFSILRRWFSFWSALYSLRVTVCSSEILMGDNCFTQVLRVLLLTPYSCSSWGYEVPPAL